jgi:hypothetical protein
VTDKDDKLDDNLAENQDDEIIDLDAPGITQSSCEFCGRDYWIDANRYTAMHEHPGCATFDALDALSFVAENNKIKQKKLKNRPRA